MSRYHALVLVPGDAHISDGTDYFLRAQWHATLKGVEQDSYTVLVTASPQAAGRVRVAVHGDDREGVQERQEEWAEWATSLPKLDASPSLPVNAAGTATQRVEETPRGQVIFDRQDQREKIETGLLPGEEIEAVFDVKGGGTGFVGITSKRIIFRDNAWVVKSMAVVSIPYSRIHTVAAEDSASLLTGRGFFSSSKVIITTSAGPTAVSKNLDPRGIIIKHESVLGRPQTEDSRRRETRRIQARDRQPLRYQSRSSVIRISPLKRPSF